MQKTPAGFWSIKVKLVDPEDDGEDETETGPRKKKRYIFISVKHLRYELVETIYSYQTG